MKLILSSKQSYEKLQAKVRNEPSVELEANYQQSYEELHAKLEDKLIAELLILLRSLNRTCSEARC